MQQNSECADMASPYTLWQYVHLMAPFKVPDYNIHPAFTQASPHSIQSMTYIQDQYLSNVNHHLHNEPNHHHIPNQHHISNHHHIPNRHHIPNQHHIDNSVSHDVCQMQNESNKLIQNENKLRKKYGNAHTNNNGNQKIQSNHIAVSFETPRSLFISSPKKMSSFTIDAILSKEDNKSAVKPLPISAIDQTNHVTDCLGTPIKSAASSPSKTTPRRPLNAIFSIPPPLMHSTPKSFQSHGLPRRHGRFIDVPHPHPYFIQQYDSTDCQQQLPRLYQHHPHILPPAQLMSTSSSASSAGSLSTSSSTSTSPESTSSSRNNDKPERRSGVKSKRIRTIFTPEQLEKLEGEFERQQYMVGNERFYLATSLNLTEAQVKVWFQNRRIKWRKQHLEQQQARLAQGDLYRDLDEDSGDSDLEEHRVTEPMTPDPHQVQSGGESGETSL